MKTYKGIDKSFLVAVIENQDKGFASQLQVTVHHLGEVKAVRT